MATQLQIPKPCQEKWHEMSPEKSDRRHCAVCEKSIVDFSHKTDAEILKHLRENNGKVCGRFRPDQLNRPVLANALHRSNAKRGGLTAMAASFAAFLSAQQPLETPITTPAKTEQRPDSLDRKVMGKVVPFNDLDTVAMRSISGKILDDMNEPVIGASIQYAAATQVQTQSDVNGFFILNIPMHLLDENILEILIRYTGYPIKQVQLPPIALKEDIALQQDATRFETPELLLGDVIVEAPLKSRIRHLFRKWFR